MLRMMAMRLNVFAAATGALCVAQQATLLWQQSTVAATYTTASIARHMGAPPTFAAATWLSPPVEVEVYNVTSGGGAVWTFSGSDAVDSAMWATMARRTEALAGREGAAVPVVDTLAVETAAIPPATVTVRAFASLGSAAPRWSAAFPGCQPAAIDLSDDGSTAALAAWLWDNSTGAISSHLWVWDAQSGALRFTLTEPLARGGPATLSETGAWVAWTQGDSVAVYDGVTGVQRGQSVSMGWNTEAQLSDTGAVLVFAGQEAGAIYAWDAGAGAWALQHAITPPDEAEWYSDSSSIASNSPTYGLLASFGWLSGGALQARVLTYTLNGTLVCDYTTPANAKLQTTTYLRSDGDYVGVALWGDSDDVPTAVVLRAGNNTPVFTYVTPGSMMDVDLVLNNAGTGLYFTVAGKHVPANVVGNGGDAFMWSIEM